VVRLLATDLLVSAGPSEDRFQALDPVEFRVDRYRFRQGPPAARSLLAILGALVMRGTLILRGAAIITRFEWVLYIFGAFLTRMTDRWSRIRVKRHAANFTGCTAISG
jgi:hypothetical protein